jgi:large subunit ribosomal protein L20
MPRSRPKVYAHRRHKKVLKFTKGQYGSRSKLFRRANEAMLKSLFYAYRDRRNRKRDFRRLWITRINAATRQNDLSYSRFIHGLKQANIQVDRKVLADIAVHDPTTFARLTEMARAAADGEAVAVPAVPVTNGKAKTAAAVEVEVEEAVEAEAEAVPTAEVEVEEEVVVEEEVEAEASTRSAKLDLEVVSFDLTKVEGIGPKISALLNEAGISSYADLAGKSEDDLRQILHDGGIGADPSTWPEQAELAAQDKWDALKDLQEKLKGGREA